MGQTLKQEMEIFRIQMQENWLNYCWSNLEGPKVASLKLKNLVVHLKNDEHYLKIVF